MAPKAEKKPAKKVAKKVARRQGQEGQEQGRVLQDLHLQGPQAGDSWPEPSLTVFQALACTLAGEATIMVLCVCMHVCVWFDTPCLHVQGCG